jgi:hypothetical protein
VGRSVGADLRFWVNPTSVGGSGVTQSPALGLPWKRALLPDPAMR